MTCLPSLPEWRLDHLGSSTMGDHSIVVAPLAPSKANLAQPTFGRPEGLSQARPPWVDNLRQLVAHTQGLLPCQAAAGCKSGRVSSDANRSLLNVLNTTLTSCRFQAADRFLLALALAHLALHVVACRSLTSDLGSRDAMRGGVDLSVAASPSVWNKGNMSPLIRWGDQSPPSWPADTSGGIHLTNGTQLPVVIGIMITKVWRLSLIHI